MSRVLYVCTICGEQWMVQINDGKDTVSVVATEHAQCRRDWDKQVADDIERQRK